MNSLHKKLTSYKSESMEIRFKNQDIKCDDTSAAQSSLVIPNIDECFDSSEFAVVHDFLGSFVEPEIAATV